MPTAIAIVSLSVTIVAVSAQTASRRDVLDAIVFYGDLPRELSQYAPDIREDFERYRKRGSDYRPRRRPADLGSEMTMVYVAREGYERKLFAASSSSGLERLAQEYVDRLRPCYEWEALPDCPEREATFAEQYLAANPAAPFADLLRVVAAHSLALRGGSVRVPEATAGRRAGPPRLREDAGSRAPFRVGVDEDGCGGTEGERPVL